MKKSFPQMPRKAEAHEAFARFFGGSGRWAAGCQSVCSQRLPREIGRRAASGTALRRKSGGAVQLPAPCGPGPGAQVKGPSLRGPVAARFFAPARRGGQKNGKKEDQRADAQSGVPADL